MPEVSNKNLRAVWDLAYKLPLHQTGVYADIVKQIRAILKAEECGMEIVEAPLRVGETKMQMAFAPKKADDEGGEKDA